MENTTYKPMAGWRDWQEKKAGKRDLRTPIGDPQQMQSRKKPPLLIAQNTQ